MTLATLVLPFDVLVPDNRRVTRTVRGRVLLTTRYREGKRAITLLARTQYRGRPMVGPLELRARVFFPDHRRRDPGNLRKALTDALAAVCYADDAQLWREVWERAGVDRGNPRVEVLIRPFCESAA
ncbi:MAG: RusA family crossover junction endodeoxyribonuclease [Gemmatimonadetes bacterium]|nr:RusA family crossover junction endodeoxyribonuclease [Gemmatimonadota bacterium]